MTMSKGTLQVRLIIFKSNVFYFNGSKYEEINNNHLFCFLNKIFVVSLQGATKSQAIICAASRGSSCHRKTKWNDGGDSGLGCRTPSSPRMDQEKEIHGLRGTAAHEQYYNIKLNVQTS